MEESRGKSEVAEMRRRIDLENEAGRLALYGYAEVSRHDRIIASMERGAERILRLEQQGRHEEAQAMMNSEYWKDEEVAAGVPDEPREGDQMARVGTTVAMQEGKARA